MKKIVKISVLSFMMISSIQKLVAGPGTSKPIIFQDPATNLYAQRQKLANGSTVIIAKDSDAKRTTKTTISRSGKKTVEVIAIAPHTDPFFNKSNPIAYRTPETIIPALQNPLHQGLRK